MYSTILLPLLFAVSGIASPAAPALEARAVCNQDNLVRCFSASMRPASSYCSSVVGSTTTTVATVTPTSTAFSTTTSTSRTTTTTSPLTTPTTTTTTSTSTQISTSVAVSTTTVTVIVTVTATETAKTVVETATVTPNKRIKRYASQLPRVAPAATPYCVTKDGSKSTSYAPSRITSACSCIGVTRSTARVTATASPTTVTRPQTVGATATSTQTTTITVTTTVTAATVTTTTTTTTSPTTTSTTTTTTGDTTTTTIPTTTTTTAAAAACTPPISPPCGSLFVTGDAGGGSTSFMEIYMGCGFRRDPTKADIFTATLFEASTSLCDAVQGCADSAVSVGAGSFSIYKRPTGQYTCHVYLTSSNSPTEYTVADSFVVQGYGYKQGS